MAGRPKKYAVNPQTGEPIFGLHLHKKTGIYYYLTTSPTTGKTKQNYLSKDFWESKERLKDEQGKLDKRVDIADIPTEKIDIKQLTSRPANNYELEMFQEHTTDREQLIEFYRRRGITFQFDEKGIVKQVSKVVDNIYEEEGEYNLLDISISNDFLLGKIRQMILQNFDQFKDKINLPISLDWSKVKANKFSLDEILQTFLGRYDIKIRDKDYKRNWGFFTKETNCSYLEDIDLKKLQVWDKWLFDKYPNQRTRQNCRSNVREIIAYYTKNTDDNSRLAEISRILLLIDKLPKIKQKVPNPKKIDPKLFQQIISISNIKYRAMFLLSANIGARQSELRDIETTQFDLEEKTLQKERHKTGVVMAGILWDETIEAIKKWLEYLENNNIESQYLFCDDDGKQLKENDTIRNYFVSKQTKLGVKKTTAFKSLRITLETHLVNNNFNQQIIDTIVGHGSTKNVKQSYMQRQPITTEQAIKVMHSYYFGGQSNTNFLF